MLILIAALQKFPVQEISAVFLFLNGFISGRGGGVDLEIIRVNIVHIMPSNNIFPQKIETNSIISLTLDTRSLDEPLFLYYQETDLMNSETWLNRVTRVWFNYGCTVQPLLFSTIS